MMEMSNNISLVDYRKRVAFLFIFMAISIASCAPAIPLDTVQEGITLAEAQKLLPFQVCLPTYLPPGIAMSNIVRYHDEFGDPNESDITINFYGQENDNPILTLYERHGPGGELDVYDNSIRNVSLRELIAWQAGWSKVDGLQSQVDAYYEVYAQSKDRLIVEIRSPESLSAVQITWYQREFVLFELYTHLSIDETKLVADSITACSSITP